MLVLVCACVCAGVCFLCACACVCVLVCISPRSVGIWKGGVFYMPLVSCLEVIEVSCVHTQMCMLHCMPLTQSDARNIPHRTHTDTIIHL